jgi:hypothetical protein
MVYRGRPELIPWNSKGQVLVNALLGHQVESTENQMSGTTLQELGSEPLSNQQNSLAKFLALATRRRRSWGLSGVEENWIRRVEPLSC